MMGERRGFTVVEMLVVAVLGTIVVGAALQVLTVNQRTYTAQTATISGQQSTRMALDVLFNELREVSPAGGDIVAMATDSLRVRLQRKFGFVCDADFATLRLTVIPWGVGVNAFALGDSVFIYADNDPDIASDDNWLEARVTAVIPTTCPQAGETAQNLFFAGQGTLFASDSVGIGAPVRSHELFTFATTTLYGEAYLARRWKTGSMVPVAGPIQSTDGLAFTYRDALGAVTNVSTDVRQIEVTVRTGSGVSNGRGGTVSDSINAWIHTRN